MKPIFSYKTGIVPASIKDIDGKKGIVTGYFSTFDNVDADGDIIRKGAFAKTIMEAGPASTQPRIKHLLNHNTSQPLGVIKSLTEDDMGLMYESQIGSHALGMDFMKMVESGLITEHSIGFQTINSKKIKDEGNELTEIKLWEGSSLTAWGANQNTPLTGMKSETKEDFLAKLIKRQKDLDKFCRNSTASDETIELLLIECKQLTQIIFEKSTMPDMIQCPICSESTPDVEAGMGYIKCDNCGKTFNSQKSSTTHIHATKPDETTLPEIKEVSDALTIFTNSLKN